jgi:hypothetical protein
VKLRSAALEDVHQELQLACDERGLHRVRRVVERLYRWHHAFEPLLLRLIGGLARRSHRC